jgi:hypothetical protein
MDDLAEGRIAAELHVGSWPPSVTQTLLHKSDGKLTLTVRGKPSGRMRVALEREGFQPLVVRTMHLRLRTPTVLKIQVVWRGNDAVVAAAGQVIGSTAKFDPAGVVSPAEVEQSAPPVDHVDNARMRELRCRQAAAMVSGSISAGSLAERCLAELVPSALVVEDLAGLVRQGRRHHLPGLIMGIRRLVQGDDQGPALLQFYAGLVDAPLILHVPLAAPSGDDPAALLAAAFDASPVRDAGHELAIDLDAWLRQEARWLGTSLPVGWLLRQAELAVAARQIMGGSSVMHEDLVRSLLVIDALCRLAECLCMLAHRLVPERSAGFDEASKIRVSV